MCILFILQRKKYKFKNKQCLGFYDVNVLSSICSCQGLVFSSFFPVNKNDLPKYQNLRAPISVDNIDSIITWIRIRRDLQSCIYICIQYQ